MTLWTVQPQGGQGVSPLLQQIHTELCWKPAVLPECRETAVPKPVRAQGQLDGDKKEAPEKPHAWKTGHSGGGFSSGVEPALSMHEVLGSIPRTTIRKKKKVVEGGDGV